MTDYVLVQGGNISTDTWNKLTNSNEYPCGQQLGSEYWKYNIKGLEEKGHRVFAPTLSNENNNNLTAHVRQICELIIKKHLKDIILVGHSYGGMVITGVASQIPDRIKVLAYLDADLPDSGQSLFDILKIAGFKPEEVVGGNPIAYTERLFYDPEKLESLIKVYILCTQSEFHSVTKLAMKKVNTENNNWNYFELPTTHIPQATMPDKLNKILLELAKLKK